MKRVFKKNQLVIGALAALLVVAGYFNFSGNSIDLAKGDKNSNDMAESAFAENDMAASAGEITIDDMEQEENIELNSAEEDIGEAVLTSTDVAAANMVNIKLNREQVRSKNKEYYLEIINGDGMDQGAVASATDAYIKLTEDMEMEAEAETLLMAKGYTNAIVSISEDCVDVVVGQTDLSDTQRAQIEDIVQRKTNCSIEEIVITSVSQ